MLHGSIEATLFAKIFIALLILLTSYGIILTPLAIGTMNTGIILKYFPSRYRVIAWTEIRKLVRRGAVGQNLYISRQRFFDWWPGHIYLWVTFWGRRDEETINRLIAVICQHARLSPKRKTLWGYDVYVRDGG
jgi:hypothetical protein